MWNTLLSFIQTIVNCAECCLKESKGKLVVAVITFVLQTIDVITDWVNWKNWHLVVNREAHHSLGRYVAVFRVVAICSSVLWGLELIIFVAKVCTFLHPQTQVQDINTEPRIRADFPLFTATVTLLVGSLEDLPVTLVTYNIAVTPDLEVPAKEQLKSWSGLAALVASAINTTWTAIVLQQDVFEKSCYCANRNRSCVEKFCNCCLFLCFCVVAILVVGLVTDAWTPKRVVPIFYGVVFVYMGSRAHADYNADDTVDPDFKVCMHLYYFCQAVTVSAYGFILFPTVIAFTTSSFVVLVS